MEPIVCEEWFSLSRLTDALRQSRIQRRVSLALAAIWPTAIGSAAVTAWACGQCLQSPVPEGPVYLALSCGALYTGLGLLASLYASGLAPWRHRWYAFLAMGLFSVLAWVIAAIAWQPATVPYRVPGVSQASAMFAQVSERFGTLLNPNTPPGNCQPTYGLRNGEQARLSYRHDAGPEPETCRRSCRSR